MSPSPPFSETRRLASWLFWIAVAGVLLYLLRGMLMPFVAGMVVAYVLDPLADRLERVGLSRLMATLVITIGFFVLFGLLLMLLLPVLHGQIMGFAGRVPDYLATVREWAEPLLARAQAMLKPEDVADLNKAVGNMVGTGLSWLGAVAGSLWSGGMAVFHLLSIVLITPLVTFYLLRDWDRMTARVDGWLPRRHHAVIREQVIAIDRTLAGFARGQATVCVILAALYGTGLSLIGLDFGLVVGMGAGLLSFIPYFGALSGFVTALGIALVQFGEPAQLGLVALVFAVGQVLEGNFLTPKLVGDKVGLHPVWIIFALMAGGSLFGFTGVLLAVPGAAAIGVLVRFGLGRYLASRAYSGGS